MYIRDKEAFERMERMMDTDFFHIPEICSVLYVAKLIRESDGKPIKMPALIDRDLDGMPDDVAEELDRIMLDTVLLIQEQSRKGKDLAQEVQSGNEHPVGDMINTPEMKQALGEVIINRLGSYERLHGDEAYKRAREIYPEIRDKLEMIFQMWMSKMYSDVINAAQSNNIPLTDATKYFKPRLEAIDPEGGFLASMNIDVDDLTSPEWKEGSTDPSYI